MPVKVFAIDHKQAFVDVGVVFEQGGGFEGSERFAAARGVPDIAVVSAPVDAIDNGLNGINLIRAHHQQFLLTGDQHHIAADHLPQRAFGQKGVGKVVQMLDWDVLFIGKLINRQEAFIGIETEVAAVVVGEIQGFLLVADDEQLKEAQQGLGVAIAGVILVIDDLLHGPARADVQ